MTHPKVYIQGHEGSFHDAVAKRYFGSEIEVVPCDTFGELSHRLSEGSPQDSAVMAIENSIAGTILANYKLLREHHLSINGEVYKRIQLNLITLPGQTIDQISEVRSHQMALKQCSHYLRQYPHIRLVESEDTALSAKIIADRQESGVACIASTEAADLYNLDILAESVEDIDLNYTRFFILNQTPQGAVDYDKASIYIRVSHQPGSLLAVLDTLADLQINVSKLQSYPVLGQFNEYYFHIDLEFESEIQYTEAIDRLQGQTLELNQLGTYRRADVSAILRNELNSFML